MVYNSGKVNKITQLGVTPRATEARNYSIQ